MGWWRIKDRGGGIDWTKYGPFGSANQIPKISAPEEMYMGDGPADIMDAALTEILSGRVTPDTGLRVAYRMLIVEWEHEWRRKPDLRELEAAFNFCTNILEDREKVSVLRKSWEMIIKG